MPATITGNTAAECDVRERGGRTHRTWTIEAKGALTTTQEIEIHGITTPCEIGLDATLIDGDSGGTTIRPAVGWISGWTIGGHGHIGQAAAADARHRMYFDGSGNVIRVPALPKNATLFLLLAPNANLGANGHAEAIFSLIEG